MRLIEFIHKADPDHTPRVGAILPDGATVVDLQAGHFSMTSAPHPLLRTLDDFRAAGPRAEAAAARVAEWVASQRPPGTTLTLDSVRLLREG